MNNRAAIYGFLFTTLEIFEILVKSTDVVEAVLFAHAFAPEVRKCMRSIGLIVFGEEPEVPDVLYIKYALLGLSNGRCYAKTKKGSIECSRFRISISSKDKQSNSRYNKMVTDYLGENGVS